MPTDTELTDPLWRGMICLSLAIDFEEDRARLGLPGHGHKKAWTLHWDPLPPLLPDEGPYASSG